MRACTCRADGSVDSTACAIDLVHLRDRSKHQGLASGSQARLSDQPRHNIESRQTVLCTHYIDDLLPYTRYLIQLRATGYILGMWQVFMKIVYTQSGAMITMMGCYDIA